MNKVNKTKKYAFMILVVFAFVALMPKVVSAADAYFHPYTPYVPTNDTNPSYPGSVNQGSQNPPSNSPNNSPSVVYNAAPVIYSISPTEATGGTAVSVSVIGNNFVAGSIVKWNNTDRVTRYISSTSLSVQLTTVDTSLAGEYQITVFNPTPGGGYSNAMTFKIPNATGATGAPEGTVTPPATDAPTETPNLSANASSSGISFFPFGLLLWLFVAIGVFLGVLLWRKFYLKKKEEGLKEKGEEEAPFKHA